MSSQPSTFHSFPSLPLELRHQIYTFSLSTPRLITLTVTRASQRKGTRLTYHHTRFHSTTPPAPLLSTTHETRFFTLHLHARLFRNPKIITTPHGFVEVHDQPPQLASEPKLGYDGIWFLPDLDTLRVSDRDLRYVPRLERGLITRRLELRVRNLQSFEEYHVDDLIDYRALRELVVVVEGLEEGNWMDERNVEHVRRDLERIKKDFGLKCDIRMRLEAAREDGD